MNINKVCLLIKTLISGLIVAFTLSVVLVTPVFAGGPPIYSLIECPYEKLPGKINYYANTKCDLTVTVYSERGGSEPCQNCLVNIYWTDGKGYIKQKSERTDDNGVVFAIFASHKLTERTMVIEATLPNGTVESEEYPFNFVKKSKAK